MSDANTPQKPPASPGEERRAPVAFYSPETYRAEESIGYHMRRIVTAVGQSVETRMCEPGSPTYPQWVPLYKLHVGAATTVASAPSRPAVMMMASSPPASISRIQTSTLARAAASACSSRPM